jgi:hypothetical protein
MASTTPAADAAEQKVEAAKPDLFQQLLDALAEAGIKPKVKWSPSKKYASLLVSGKNVGYVFKQSNRGMRVEPAAQKADLPRTVKGFKPSTRGGQFGLVGTITKPEEVASAVEAIKVADEKRKAAAAA